MDETPVGMSEEDSGKRKKNSDYVTGGGGIFTEYYENEKGTLIIEK